MEKLNHDDIFLYKEQHFPIESGLNLVKSVPSFLFGDYRKKFSSTNNLIKEYNDKNFSLKSFDELAIEIAWLYKYHDIKKCNLVSSYPYLNSWFDYKENSSFEKEKPLWFNLEEGVNEKFLFGFKKKLENYGLKVNEIKLVEMPKIDMEIRKNGVYKKNHDYFFK